MTKTKKSRATTAAGEGSEPPGPSRRRYHRDALTAVLTMLDTVSRHAATAFAAIAAARGTRCGRDETAIDRAALTAMMTVCEGDKAGRDLIDTLDALTDVLAMNVVDTRWRQSAVQARWNEASGAEHLPISEAIAESAEPDKAAGHDDVVVLSAEFVSLLDEPLPSARRSALIPRLNTVGRRDNAVVEAIMASGDSGHLAVRRRAGAVREVGDLAALLGSDERVLLLVETTGKSCFAALVRAELHAGATPPLVLVARDLLTEGSPPPGDEWDETLTTKPASDISHLAATMPGRLVGARGLYLWSVPEAYVPSSATLPWIGACIGPMAFDPGWSRQVIADHLGADEIGKITSPGVTALARRVADPRDVFAMAATARSIAAGVPENLDSACARVAASFVVDRGADTDRETLFDARLLVCEAEAHRLLARARDAAANGARVLAYGPPGGGKSAFIRELARRMAAHDGRFDIVGRPIRICGPADVLAKAWGATERQVRDLWRRAQDDHAILVMDEFEAVGGRRVHGDMSNNAMLIRSLTDAWLNAMDEFADVPLLASTNDPGSIDPAIVRRFAFVLEFGDRLSPAQERLAWSVVLGMAPPPTWRPIGASVADVVMAKQRCRMLDMLKPEALAASIQSAYAARAKAQNEQRIDDGDRRLLH